MLVVGAESVEMGAGVFVDADGLDRSAFDEQTEPVAVESDGASPRDQTRSNFHTVWQADPPRHVGRFSYLSASSA